MESYEQIRAHFRPRLIKWLLIAESPPPEASKGGSRHFYRSDQIGANDRLFMNTVKAVYPESAELTANEIGADKVVWLQRLKDDGLYLIEALEESQPHEVTKPDRRAKIEKALPRLIERLWDLAKPETKIILIKSNVFEVAAEPLRQAGFTVLNQGNIDYPGRFNQAAYRQKLAEAMTQAGWKGSR